MIKTFVCPGTSSGQNPHPQALVPGQIPLGVLTPPHREHFDTCIILGKASILGIFSLTVIVFSSALFQHQLKLNFN